MEYKVIREDKFGVYVQLTWDKTCANCKYYGYGFVCNIGIGDTCEDARYLTEEEEKEYYSAKNV